MSTTIDVNNDTSGTNFRPKTKSVTAGSSLTFKSTGPQAISFSTWQGGVEVNVFTSGKSPYSASRSGKTFTLSSSITGTITLSVAGASVHDTGTNGTINVGTGDTE